MAADDSTTWGAVCSKVGFSDNLYRDCRRNVPGFNGGGMANSAFDDVPDDDYGPDSRDFKSQLADSALAIPDAPSADWKAEPEGFFESLPIRQVLMYGGIAAVVWFLLMKAKVPQEGAAAATGAALPKNVATSPKAA